MPGQAWVHVVRSPHAHAVIERIDTMAARAMPGVLGVYTATDIADLGLLPCTRWRPSAPMIVPPRHALANGRVRHVGDPVAFVVAETRHAARDAAELVDGGLHDRCHASWMAPAAMQPGAPQLWDQAPGNVIVSFPTGDQAAVQDGDRRGGACRRTGVGQQPPGDLADGDARRDRPNTTRRGYHLMFSGAGVHAICDPACGQRVPCARDADARSPARMSAAASASRTPCIPNG